MTGDTTPQRPFAVIYGGDEKPTWTEVIPNETTDYTVKTFGELFADFAYQLRKGEHANLMHRLNECASEYGAAPMPEVSADQSEDDAHDVDCAMHAAEAGNAGSWPIVADVLRLEVLRLRGLLCSSPVVQPQQDEEGSSLRSSEPSALGEDSAVYIRLSNRPVNKTVSEYQGSVNVDLDDYDEPVGVEILGAVSVEIDGIEVSR